MSSPLHCADELVLAPLEGGSAMRPRTTTAAAAAAAPSPVHPDTSSSSTAHSPSAASQGSGSSPLRQSLGSTTAAVAAAAAAAANQKPGKADLINRTVFTILMAYVFLAGISFGIVFGVLLVMLVQSVMFHEITRINQSLRKEKKIPSIHLLKWYFYIVVTAYLLLYTLREPLTNTFPVTEAIYGKLAFFVFIALILGVVLFVLSLRKGMYRYQFIQFTWTVMSLMILAAQSGAELRNMMRGMVWFLLPVSCVINNDTWAYIFGKLFGRTKLLALSPKKTMEGFAGAFVFTVVWAFWFCGFLGSIPGMHCPAVGFTNSANAHCEMDPVFIQAEVALPALVQALSGGHLTSMMVSTAQKHAVMIGIFGSLVAPFGGFFASGLKRAFKLKDFGDLIPGHGGMTDRMDCQGLLGLFTYFYLRAYVYNEARCLSSAADIANCAMQLSAARRRDLAERIMATL